jgi:hypothetical protein
MIFNFSMFLEKYFRPIFFRPRFFPDSQLRGKGNNFEDAKKFSLSNLGQVSIDPFEDKNKGLFTRSTKNVRLCNPTPFQIQILAGSQKLNVIS